MASTYLSRATSSAGNQLKHTISFWFKRSNISSNQCMISASGDNSHANKRLYIFFSSGDFLYVKQYNGSGTDYELITNRTFRDTNAWYHCVIQYDAVNSTANNRQRIWINGVEETSFSARTNPSTSTNSYLGGNGLNVYVGQDTNVSSRFFDGSISHLHYCDGYTYTASDFGSFDNDTGEWSINTSPSVSYGTTGFLILKDGNTITDQSSNSNDFSLGGGTLTKTEDNPSNVFATGNPLMVKLGTWSNGNNSIVGSSSSQVRPQMWSTLGAKSGKFYAEAKYTDTAGGMVGVSDYTGTMEMIRSGVYQGHATNSVGFWQGGDKYVENNSVSWGNSWSNNDIIQIAMDLDNMCVYFGINGTWQESGDPTSGASKTGGITIPNSRNEEYFMSWGDGSSGSSATCHVNYGNGYFGTTAVSSAGTNASGIGIFEYDVPTGYTALSTKGLNQ